MTSLVPEVKQAEPRPRTMTPEMGEIAARSVVEDLVKAGHLEPDQIESSVKDVAKCGRRHMDGYELAKELDSRCYWDCDLNMAEELDGFSGYVGALIKDAQKAWAERNGITPPFPDGTAVRLCASQQTGETSETGIVDGVYEYGVAEYKIKIDGDLAAEGPTQSRRLVYFEDVEAIGVAAESAT